jgi:hypothetical protein
VALIEAQSPAPYLELFARRLWPGWASWFVSSKNEQSAGAGEILREGRNLPRRLLLQAQPEACRRLQENITSGRSREDDRRLLNLAIEALPAPRRQTRDRNQGAKPCPLPGTFRPPPLAWLASWFVSSKKA